MVEVDVETKVKRNATSAAEFVIIPFGGSLIISDLLAARWTWWMMTRRWWFSVAGLSWALLHLDSGVIILELISVKEIDWKSLLLATNRSSVKYRGDGRVENELMAMYGQQISG